jgi:hypothetical protein
MNTLPECVQEKTQKATEGLLPFKSQDKYEKDYEIFRIWQSKYEIATVRLGPHYRLFIGRQFNWLLNKYEDLCECAH